MYSPEFIKFLLDYKKEAQKPTKKYFKFNDGNRTFNRKFAHENVTVSSK